MVENNKTYEVLYHEIAALKEQLDEAHDIINAIKVGEVDAFIVKADDKHELYTLKSADKTYRIFIERMSEGALTLNRGNIILYCNSSFAEFVQKDLENVIARSFHDFVEELSHPVVEKLIKTAWQKGESKGEAMLFSESKSIPVLLSMNTMETDSETALSLIITDLSLQKEAHEQRKAMEQKDEFISIASHELKTPVTSIKGYVQILKHTFQKKEDHAAAELLNKADIQLNKLSGLINDLLDVKKIENGQLQYNQEVFDLNELVKEIIDETARVLSGHFIIDKLSGNCKVSGDRNKIGQVVTNLLENAGKYSPPGTDIVVSSIEEKDTIKVSVEDRGIGIPAEQQSRIFERFFRVKGDKENTFAGLGLGLYISAEIVKRHGGNIGVESEEGKGSAFFFELPRHF